MCSTEIYYAAGCDYAHNYDNIPVYFMYTHNVIWKMSSTLSVIPKLGYLR